MAKRQHDRRVLVSGTLYRHKFVSVFLILCSLALFLYAFTQLKQRHEAVSTKPQLPNASDVVNTNISEPEESKPNTEQYTVPADQPRRIVLPTIAAEGIIQKVSLTPERAIAVPSNINYAGWYAPSVKPGEAGLSIIDGHVSGKYADGIFKNIHKLRVGDEFSVEYGDLSKVNFQVVEVTSLPEAESLSYLLKKRDDISKQLNLITCGGKYNKQTSTYEDRVIVVSKQI